MNDGKDKKTIGKQKKLSFKQETEEEKNNSDDDNIKNPLRRPQAPRNLKCTKEEKKGTRGR